MELGTCQELLHRLRELEVCGGRQGRAVVPGRTLGSQGCPALSSVWRRLARWERAGPFFTKTSLGSPWSLFTLQLRRQQRVCSCPMPQVSFPPPLWSCWLQGQLVAIEATG